MLRIKKKLATLPLYIAVTCMPTCLFETRQNQTVLLSPRLTFSYVLWMTNLEGVCKRFGLETRLDYEYPEGLTVLHAGTDMILQNSFWRAVSLIVLTSTRWLSISLCKALTKGCSLVQHWHTLKEVWHLCIWVWECESVRVWVWECESVKISYKAWDLVGLHASSSSTESLTCSITHEYFPIYGMHHVMRIQFG